MQITNNSQRTEESLLQCLTRALLPFPYALRITVGSLGLKAT